MFHQRKGGWNCFEQDSYNFSHRKRWEEEAKVKGPEMTLCFKEKLECNKSSYKISLHKAKTEGLALSF